MLVTDNFVLLNIPKTGSTFVRDTMKRVYASRQSANWLGLRKSPQIEEIAVPQYRSRIGRWQEPEFHGIFSQIPNDHVHKQVISVYRGVYDKTLSHYTYRDWTNFFYPSKEILMDEYPSFPNLSFMEYLQWGYKHMAALDHPEIKQEATPDVGWITVQFVKFFFKNPFDVLSNCLNDDYFFSGDYKEDMCNVRFLRFENLNQDVFALLKGQGFKEKELSSILEEKKVNKSRPEGKGLQDYYSAEVKELVAHKERYMLHMEKDLKYWNE